MYAKYISMYRKNVINLSNNLCRNLSSSVITAALRPFYFLVHPDLFASYPKVQYINDASLKILNSHLHSVFHSENPSPVTLQFYIKGNSEGQLETKTLVINEKDLKFALQNILQTFKLPTHYVDRLQIGGSHSESDGSSSSKVHFYDYSSNLNVASQHNRDDLYSWLVKNMGEAEKRLEGSKPIREDIEKLKTAVVDTLGLSRLTYVRGMGTIHLRGCLQGLIALTRDHCTLMKTVLNGRHIHLGNETGVSLKGSIILSTSEVRDQWLKIISRVQEVDHKIVRIPYMQKAVSNTLRDIEVTHRKYQPYFLAEAYSDNLRKFVTSLGDYLGRSGYPLDWPESLSHLQLVVESASGPLMLSPTGQIIAPASCPPCQLINFISEHMEEATNLISQYRSIRIEEKELHSRCMKEFALSFLDKDDSVSPQLMVDCLSRLLGMSNQIEPLLVDARIWITHYYSVMLDGEVCIPYDWNKG